MKLFAVTLGCLSLLAVRGQACDYYPLPLNQAVGAASDVFVGAVRSVETHGSLVKGRVIVERSWKGVRAGRQVTVYTSQSDCGVFMRPGLEVIIFARRGTIPGLPGQLFTERPDGSGELVNVGQLTKELGPPLTCWKRIGR